MTSCKCNCVKSTTSEYCNSLNSYNKSNSLQNLKKLDKTFNNFKCSIIKYQKEVAKLADNLCSTSVSKKISLENSYNLYKELQKNLGIELNTSASCMLTNDRKGITIAISSNNEESEIITNENISNYPVFNNIAPRNFELAFSNTSINILNYPSFELSTSHKDHSLILKVSEYKDDCIDDETSNENIKNTYFLLGQSNKIIYTDDNNLNYIKLREYYDLIVNINSSQPDNTHPGKDIYKLLNLVDLVIKKIKLAKNTVMLSC